MLQAINDRIKGWLGGAVIALISLPFALWGIQSYLGGGEAPNAASVDDVKISVQELDNSVTRKKQELRERFGETLPFEDSMIKAQVLEQLINQRLMEAYTIDNGYRVSDMQLYSNIKSLFSQNGEFDRAIFESLIRSRGQTVRQFEDALRSDIRVSQFSTGVRATSFVTDAELQHLAKLEAQQREVSLLKFSVSDQLDSVEVSEQEVQAAYESRGDQFMTNEQVSLSYIELTADQLAKDVVLDEQKIKRAYDDYVARLAQTEQRKARHILIKPEPDRAAALEKISSLQAELAQGKAFASLAKEFSEDKGSAQEGGDLDWVEYGQMVKPFEEALFALKKSGDISDVVETQFGLHLIQLEDIRTEKPLSLSEMRAQFEAELKREAISDIFYDQTELLATSSYENPDSLDISAEALGVSVQKTALLTRAFGTGIAANPAVREIAFSRSVLHDGVNSDIIELGPDHIVVIRVNEHLPASRLALEQVRDRLVQNLKREKVHAVLLDKAREAKQKIIAGAQASSLVKPGVVLEKPQLVKRNDADKLNPTALRLAFEISKPVSDQPSVAVAALPNADVAVVIVSRVVTPETVAQAELDALRTRRVTEIANAEFDAALAEISTRYSVSRNPRAFE